jgi:LuxR family maltose regulon positive regulatory protein
MWLTCEQHRIEMMLLRGEMQVGISLAQKDIRNNPELPSVSYLRVIYELLCLGSLQNDLAKETLGEIQSMRCHETGREFEQRLVAARILFDFAVPGQNGSTDRTEGLHETDSVLACARKLGNRRILISAALQRIHMEVSLPLPSSHKMSDLLREAIVYAAPEQMAMPFYLERAGITPLLYDLAIQEGNKRLSPMELAFVRRVILLSTEKVARKAAASEAGPSLLTDREREVLDELALGITNREIAEKLFISQATVKTHVLSIFSKLGVSSRTMAVERARLLGILHTV